MHQACKTTAITLAGLAVATQAFAPATPTTRTGLARYADISSQRPQHYRRSVHTLVRLYNAEDDDAQDNEILRLKKMAAKLRAEAASLEAAKASQLAEAAEKAFRKFDLNSDGEINVSELKAGLEKELKVR